MKHNIYNYIKENREEAKKILSTLPDNRLKLVDDIDWDSIEQNGIISDKDIDKDEIRDLPAVVVCDGILCDVVVLDIFLFKGEINFSGAKISEEGEYINPEVQGYSFDNCALYMENIIFHN